MDLIWLGAGATFFIGTWGIVSFFGYLRGED